MIRIIDRTLICIRAYRPDKDLLCELAALLFSSGADLLEVSPDEYEALRGVSPGAQYILRVQNLNEARRYSCEKDVKRFVCAGRHDTSLRVYSEIRLNDIRDSFTIVRCKDYGRVRVCGLADAILQPVETVLDNLRSAFRGTIELSPENDCFAATSLAVEWALTGGSNVVTSFFGMDNMAAFEDVTQALCILKGRKTKCGFSALDRTDALLKNLIAG